MSITERQLDQETGRVRMVPAVERAIRLIDHLSSSNRPIGLAELTRRLDVPKSSLHGLLATLTTRGLAIRSADNEYSLGPRILQWAGSHASQSMVINAFNVHSADSDSLVSETMMLAVMDGTNVIYLACREGNRPLAVNFRVGGRFPACCTSSGKAMLSTLPDSRVTALLGASALSRVTQRSVETVDALLGQLSTFRRDGFAVDDEETAEGMICFGAPVYAVGNPSAVAAVAVSLIKATVTEERKQDTVAAIKRLAGRISSALGVHKIETSVADSAVKREQDVNFR